MSALSRMRDAIASGLLSGAKRLASEGWKPWDDRWYSGELGGSATSAGVPVTTTSAMRSSVVNACVRMWSYPTASCPIMVVERLANGGKRRATEHPLYRLLHDQPNEYQTAWEFKQEVFSGLAMRGQSMIEKIVSVRRGAVDQLWPIHPDSVRVDWFNRKTGRRRVYDVASSHDGHARVLLDDKVWHPRLMSLDGGLNGASPISLASEGIGVALQAQRMVGRLLRNDSRPPGVIKSDQVFKNHAEADALRERWQQQQSGDNYGAPAVLGSGAEYKATSITPRDAQLIETMNWGSYDLARVWGMALWMIQLEQKATAWGTGMGVMRLGVYTDTFFPLFTLVEEGLQRSVVGNDSKFFPEFNVDALLRADIETRYKCYQIGVNANNPWLKRNDILRSETMELDNGPDGEKYMKAENNVGGGANGTGFTNGKTGSIDAELLRRFAAFTESEQANA